MNYAGPIMGSVCILSWIWYKLHWVGQSGFEDELFELIQFVLVTASQLPWSWQCQRIRNKIRN